MTNQLNKNSALALAAARAMLGWLMLYAGLTHLLDLKFSAAGYITQAKTFVDFYAWLAQPAFLPAVNFLNVWGLTLLGVSLILGIGVRFSSVLGAVLMLLYYFPVLDFPYVARGFLVDQHIIYASVLIFFATIKAGRYYGLENWCENLPICRNYKGLHKFWG